MLRYRTGVASAPAAGRNMARYLSGESLTRDAGETLARYYVDGTGAEVVAVPRTHAEALGQLVAAGRLGFAEAVDELTRAGLSQAGDGADAAGIRARATDELAAGVQRAEAVAAITAKGGGQAIFRRDMDPRLAESLGIDMSRPPTEDELGNLLNGLRADGAGIKGRQIQKPGRSLLEVFGLDPKAPPTGEALDHVLAGRQADGQQPFRVGSDGEQNPLPAEAVQGALKRLTALYGVPSHRAGAPTPEEARHMRDGRMANGVGMNLSDYRRLATAQKLPVAYIDFVLSPHKSVSAAFALAPTDAERAIVAQIHKDAVAGTMGYVETLLGHTRKGKAGRDGTEAGSIGWVRFAHYTARPTAETVQQDQQGRDYTAFHRVPVRAPDFQLHDHTIVFNAVQTQNKVGAMDLDRLDGLVHEVGAVYQAFVAAGARRHGIDVARDGAAARFTAVPAHVSAHFSKRHAEGREAAAEYAASQGLDWNSLNEKQRAAMLDAGTEERKRRKDESSLGNFDDWKRLAREQLGYQHRSVLRPDAARPELTPEQRLELAYRNAQPLLAEEFARSAKLGGDRVRAIAAQAMIETGLRDTSEIGALTRLFRERGVHLDGADKPATALLWGEDVAVRGKQRISVTTSKHVDEERALVDMAKAARGAKAPLIDKAALEQAIEARGLTLNPDQRAAVETIAGGSQLEVVIAAAGAGKSKAILPPLVDSWAAQGRAVYGVAQAWKHSAGGLDGSGIEPERLLSIASFLKRERERKLELTANSVVVVDEVGRLGVRETLSLLELRARTGFQLVMLGDPKQCAAVEAGSSVDLLARAMPIPEVLTTMRQRTERERALAGLFREGQAGAALEMKRADNTVELVAGGRDRTVQRVAALWHERMVANRDTPGFTLTISAPSNAEARGISLAIRAGRQARGEIGADQVVVAAIDKNSRETYDLALSVGDKVRLFDRVNDASRPKGSSRVVLGSNGDVVEVLALSQRGMTVRAENGKQGLVEWARLRPLGEAKTGRVRLALGYALTVDTAQGITSTEHIAALPTGTRAVPVGKHYVAGSRHRETTWLVIDEASERRQITKSRPLGGDQIIRHEDVWNQVAANMGRRSDRANATDFVQSAVNLQRGATQGLQAGRARHEGRQHVGLDATTARPWLSRLRHRAAIARVAEHAAPTRLAEMSKAFQNVVARAAAQTRAVAEHVHERTRYRGIER